MNTKEELLSVADQICREYPKNSSQKFQGYLSKNHLRSVIDECQALADRCNLKLAAGFYMYVHSMTEPPKCIDCHNEVPRFISFNEGFLQRCKVCGTKYSHEHLTDVTRNKSPETIAKLTEINRARGKLLREANAKKAHIELTQSNIELAQEQAQKAFAEGTLTHPMNNLKLNKMRRDYPTLMEVAASLMNEGKTKKILEGLYWMLHKLDHAPHCQLHLDDKCIDVVTFVDLEHGYHEACGQCSKHKPGSAMKSAKTYFARTGYTNPAKNPDVIKLRGDNFEAEHGPGVRHHMQTQEGRQKVIDAVLELTGGEYKYMVNVPEVHEKGQKYLKEHKEEVQETTIETYRKNWGRDRYQSGDEFVEQLRTSISTNPKHQNGVKDAIENLKLFHIEILQIPTFFKDSVPFRCTICGHTGEINISKIKSGNTWVCPVCHPYHGNQSKGEYDVMVTIKDAIPGIKHEFSNKSILDGREVDIYYPDYGIGIEYSGCKYHSSYLCDGWDEAAGTCSEDYHYQKWLGCKNKGIKLFTIFDDEWVIMKYRWIAIPSIMEKFGVYTRSIDINDCTVLPCHDSLIIYKFMAKCCLDRFDDYTNAYMVTHKGEGIAIFAWSDMGDYYNIRYTRLKGTKINNGFEQLLNRFRSEHPSKPLRWSVNRNWFDCPELEQFGFKVVNDSMNLNQFYWGKTLYKRKMLVDFNEDNQKMLNEGKLNYLYDCGNVIYQHD